jgi:uncharacterized membrane protein (UPF0127 family)
MRTDRAGKIAVLAWIAAVVAYGGLVRADTAREALDELFTRSTLQIATPDARLHAFDVWVADNDRRRARGLMYVERLDDDEGMLFVYPQAQPVSMWMKNTKIALDMLFVRGDGRIERVVENTTPLSLETIDSGAPVTAVIELKAGTAAKLKIRPGALVIHPAFSQGSGR